MTGKFIFILIIMLGFTGCAHETKQQTGQVVVQDVQFEDIVEDDIDPPPEDLTSRFKTVQDWLLDVCDNNHPPKSIARYNFGLFESPNDFTLVVYGVNTYDEGKNRSVTRIEFEPTNMYFRLPK